MDSGLKQLFSVTYFQNLKLLCQTFLFRVPFHVFLCKEIPKFNPNCLFSLSNTISIRFSEVLESFHFVRYQVLKSLSLVQRVLRVSLGRSRRDNSNSNVSIFHE